MSTAQPEMYRPTMKDSVSSMVTEPRSAWCRTSMHAVDMHPLIDSWRVVLGEAATPSEAVARFEGFFVQIEAATTFICHGLHHKTRMEVLWSLLSPPSITSHER